jgi:hypothetical protein
MSETTTEQTTDEKIRDFSNGLGAVLQEALKEIPIGNVLAALMTHYTHIMLLAAKVEVRNGFKELEESIASAQESAAIRQRLMP